MCENRVLILADSEDDNSYRISNCKFVRTYKKLSFLRRIMRNISVLVGFTLTPWHREINNYRTIIIFDGEITIALLKYLKRKTKNTRIIVYYRNTVATVPQKIHPNKIRSLGCELWSYSKDDCKKFRMNYNMQFINVNYFNRRPTKSAEIEYDVIFVARAKDREQLIEECYNHCVSQGLKSYFYVPDGWHNPNNKCKIAGQAIPYKEYLKLVKKSRAIIDLVSDTNFGLTWRAVEALFLNKKLITNYREIINYDFYNSNNILLYSKDANIENFIKQEMVTIPEDIIMEYDVKKWLERFFYDDSEALNKK